LPNEGDILGWKRRAAWLLGSVSGVGVLGVMGLRSLNFSPSAREPLVPECIRPGKLLKPGDTFSVLSWNLQFAGSRKEAFFYDGGTAVHVPEARVQETMKGMAKVIQENAPDVLFLQEVDRDSARTGRVDQLQAYLGAGEWACWSSTPYHKSRYVPHPSHEHLGRIDLHMAVLSRFALASGERIALPGLAEGWLRKQFNLKRALQWVSLPVEGAPPIRLGNTHLSAFSHGDGTLSHQVGVLKAWMGLDESWLLAGDMNMLPPGDDPSRLETPGSSYGDDPNPIEVLNPERFDVAKQDLLAESARTYLPFGAEKPDRKIDYLLASERLELVEERVLIEASEWSDHLPVWAVFRVR
jgi:endonuclease/exonuclease/phosphatase family metal-dependent hydrolase